ncbi:Elongator protein 3/MiaB/NifB,Aldolase-type TIM barrel,Radical SAM,Antiviral radical SAM protein viperin [Cinara cedri]|uniref:S-adenosylmethionine-dependent nucleotide dehydratase RSAD2 n=2 Tax=Cinara cedri TaxID=506608 RepID=A0A5E4MFQ2_9HEMI|nr:Elongator protein 3/MiaB/NifB,Aldolase-type TIM barrel,Radical SAM,Antiviral radical SAM protein viperin [Cinara cedri]
MIIIMSERLAVANAVFRRYATNACNAISRIFLTLVRILIYRKSARENTPATVPISVNYHFTRRCNYSCGFCFHTAKTSFVLPLDEAKRGLAMLAKEGMKKLNFSGGEPFIKDGGRFMGELIRYCKTELGWADISVSIVSNGSLIRETWMRKYGEHVDMLAVSCDSFDAETNRKIGRQQGARTDHVAKLNEVREWCTRYKIAFKINTVVNTYNINELFSEHINNLRPVRWKVFQCLLLEGENAGEDALRDASRFYVTGEEFEEFLRRHSGVKALVPESNDTMRDSYLILDEYMRFLNCRNGKKEPSASLLDVGVRQALRDSGFDERAFQERGGVYVWNKNQMPSNQLDW